MVWLRLPTWTPLALEAANCARAAMMLLQCENLRPYEVVAMQVISRSQRGREVPPQIVRLSSKPSVDCQGDIAVDSPTSFVRPSG